MTMIAMCKPSLAWSLICKAVQMCQKLGLNRLASSASNSDAHYNRKVGKPLSSFLSERSLLTIGRHRSFSSGQYMPLIGTFLFGSVKLQPFKTMTSALQ